MTIHGGAIATMLDSAGWFTIAQYFENWIATVEFSTRLLDFSKDDELIATGHLARLGKRICDCHDGGCDQNRWAIDCNRLGYVLTDICATVCRRMKFCRRSPPCAHSLRRVIKGQENRNDGPDKDVSDWCDRV